MTRLPGDVAARGKAAVRRRRPALLALVLVAGLVLAGGVLLAARSLAHV